MEERVKTSFIPKTTLQTATVPKSANKNPVALANLVTGVLLVLSIVVAGAVFFFERYTESSISSKQESLARSREAFEPATIQELSRLNTRIEAAKVILKQHVAVSGLFNELENLTLSSIRFNKFDYLVASPGHVVLTMSGEAESYNAIAVQSESFGKSQIITDPIFSNVTIGPSGTITFDFTGIIDTRHLIFGATLPASGQGQSQLPQTSSSTQPTP